MVLCTRRPASSARSPHEPQQEFFSRSIPRWESPINGRVLEADEENLAGAFPRSFGRAHLLVENSCQTQNHKRRDDVEDPRNQSGILEVILHPVIERMVVMEEPNYAPEKESESGGSQWEGVHSDC